MPTTGGNQHTRDNGSRSPLTVCVRNQRHTTRSTQAEARRTKATETVHSTRKTDDSSDNTNERHTCNDAIWMTPRQVSEAFGIGTETLAKWARHGKIHFAQTAGGHRRYRHEDVQSAMRSFEFPAQAPARIARPTTRRPSSTPMSHLDTVETAETHHRRSQQQKSTGGCP